MENTQEFCYQSRVSERKRSQPRMWTHGLWFLCCVGLSAVPQGCTSESSYGGVVTKADFDGLYEDYCSARVECGCQEWDLDVCHQGGEQRVVDTWAAKEAGELTLNEDCFWSKRRVFDELGCSQWPTANLRYEIANHCQLFFGLALEGESCSWEGHDYDCAEGLICVGGACVRRPTGQDGEVCVGSGEGRVSHQYSCGEGMTCAFPGPVEESEVTVVDMVCQAAVGEGEACDPLLSWGDYGRPDACEPGLHCRCTEPECNTGVCAEPPTGGEPCAGRPFVSGDGYSERCADGFSCWELTDTCMSRGTVGASCGPGLGRCEEGLSCTAGECRDPGGYLCEHFGLVN